SARPGRGPHLPSMGSRAAALLAGMSTRRVHHMSAIEERAYERIAIVRRTHAAWRIVTSAVLTGILLVPRPAVGAPADAKTVVGKMRAALEPERANTRK